jgi:LemA protein
MLATFAGVLLIGVAALVVVVLFALVAYYNRFVTLRNRIDNAWHQIDVQLRRRYDLIPNLVETVKGYAAHERGTFEAVTAARTAAMSAKTVGEQAQAENMLAGTLKTLFAVSEAYPELKANQNFLALQEELTGTEGKIAYARQFYNDMVYELNNAIQRFPGNIVAGMFGIQPKEYFEVGEAAAREPVKVKF